MELGGGQGWTFDVISGLGAYIAFPCDFVIVSCHWLVVIYC